MIQRLTAEKTEILAQKMRVVMGVSASEAINAKTMIRNLNIQTMYRSLSENSYGVSVKSSGGVMFMLVNSETSRGCQHFTIAHELYHLFYDDNPAPHICHGQSVPSEREANLFASALLMPREGVVGMIEAGQLKSGELSIATILKLEQYFQVSRQTLLVRLKELHIITERQRQSLAQIPVIQSARDYGYNLDLYRKGNENVVISDFGVMARTLFDNEKISEGHYLELLRMIGHGEM